MGQAARLPLPEEPSITLEEWAALPEDEPGEVIDGRLEEDEVPGFLHELVVGWLIRVLGNWLAGRGGFVGGSDAKLGVGRHRGRKPDALVYLPGSPRPPAQGLITVPPDLAIEVVTPTPRDVRRDRVEKLVDYAAFGIRWYWIVDPQLRTVEVLELGADGRYIHALGAADGVVAEVPGCPGLSLDLDALWAEADALVAATPSAEAAAGAPEPGAPPSAPSTRP